MDKSDIKKRGIKKGEILLIVPMSISVNQAYSSNFKTGRRFISKKYKEWKIEAKNKLLLQPQYKIEGENWLEVRYRFFTQILNKNGTKKVKDVANYEKTLSDMLSENIKGFEDHKIKKMTLEKIESEREEIEISIKEKEKL